jgi:hypothetical protein
MAKQIKDAGSVACSARERPWDAEMRRAMRALTGWLVS